MELAIFTASLEDPRVVYALVRVVAAPASVGAALRRPVNLSLAVDCSSSMRGPRIARARQAVRQVMERLDERDRLSVVTFDSAAHVLHPPGPVTEEARKRLDRALEALRTHAGTNLAAGWKKGSELVASAFVREATSRVVLLTDGHASVGIRDADKLSAIAEQELARGVTTTTMGIGEGYDDELLAEIARRGRGGYYYLATPEAIPAAFGQELRGVFSIAASAVELKILPEAGVHSLEVLHRLVIRAVTGGLCIDVGEVAAGAPRQVLLKMTRADAVAGQVLAKVALTWRDGSVRGEPRLDRIQVPRAPVSEAVAEVALERLRIASVGAIDEAWARRASGRRDEAIAALADVRSAIHGAMERGLAPKERLEAMDAELIETETALRNAARDLERRRRAARERSHVTLLGHSVIGRLPDDE